MVDGPPDTAGGLSRGQSYPSTARAGPAGAPTCFRCGAVTNHAATAKGSGTILFTGASAGVKGYPQSAPFAMGKFALRGLAQSMARELAPKGIHVGHFVIDGGIGESDDPKKPNKLDPDDIAESYFHVHKQERSAWTWEMELRPFVENF